MRLTMPKILLVDKDEALEKTCRTFFQGCGYTVEDAIDIETAVSKMATSPELLILDLDFGIQEISLLLIEIKKNPHPPFIIIHSHNKHLGTEYSEIMGLPQIRGFLVRPFPIYRLAELVVQIFPIEQTDDNEDSQTDYIPSEQIQRWIGQDLSGCILETCISFGNFSLVYKGTYQEKPVVVKILTNIMQQKERMVRFQREVEILSRFKHPNIIEVLTTGKTEDGIFYMIMPYFNGENLDQILLKEQKLQLSEACDIVYQVSQGMAAIHTTQVIHRDLKPANILYNRQEHIAKVIDFGLVRDVGLNTMSQAITRRGYILGTPYYMSPEQCEGRFMDTRTDIYSLGITFYQLLTGLVPFDKSSPIKTLLAHIREPLVWPDSIVIEIPVEVRNLIEKMTAKKASERYQNMSDIVKELDCLHRQFKWDF